MKTILPFLFALLFCVTINLNAQNLVSNPGFELANKKPERKGNGIARAKDWIAPLYNSDFYLKGSDRQVGTPKNRFGKQMPHSGNAYAGICLRKKFCEYLETKLTTPLTNDKDYLIEFYISRADRSLGSVKEFGVLFTNKNIWGLTGRGISDKPQIIFTNSKGYKNKKEWTKLSAVYRAEGNEAFLILGHFNYNPADKQPKIRCHYYIDDVTITPLEKDSDPTSSSYNKELSFEEDLPQIGEIVTLKNIFFPTNKSELMPESFLELDKLAGFLWVSQNTQITIMGNTDNTGNEDMNQSLSELRAKAVADYLILKGIDKSRINYIGYGSSKPIATNDTDEGKQKNRRVEFTINKR